jgi:hypothetical protein
MAEIREVWGEKNMPNLTTFSGDLLRTKEGRVIFIETADGERYPINRVEDTTEWPDHGGTIDFRGKAYTHDGSEFTKMMQKLEDVDGIPLHFGIVLVNGSNELYLFRRCIKLGDPYGGRGVRVLEFAAMRGIDHTEAVEFLLTQEQIHVNDMMCRARW